MFESRPEILNTKVYPAFHPPGSVNEYQLRLGRQRQVFRLRMKRRVRIGKTVISPENECYTGHCMTLHLSSRGDLPTARFSFYLTAHMDNDIL